MKTALAHPAVLSALAAAVLFGASTPLAKQFVGDLPALLLAGLLYLGSGIGLTAVRLVRDRGWKSAPLQATEWPWLLGAIFFGGMVGPVLLMFGLARTAASTASLLLNLEAVLTAVLAWIVFRENADRRIVFDAPGIVGLANDRCNQENVIAQLKGRVKAMRMPVDDLMSNWAYMVMAALAWNLKAWFGLLLPNRERGMELVKMAFRRFLHALILLPTQIVRSGRRIIYRIQTFNAWVGDLFSIWEKLRRAAPAQQRTAGCNTVDAGQWEAPLRSPPG